MNFSVLLFVVIKCFHLSTAKPNESTEQVKIMGGQEAFPHSHPYVVSLQTRLLFLRVHICGGTLIHEQFILSAAHCATESWLVRWLPLDAVAGVHDVNQFSARTQVVQILDRIPHPLYDGGIGPHDIALFKTVRPFVLTKVVQPIKFSTNYNYKSGDSLKVLGWGALRTTSFFPDLPYGLQEVDVTYIPYKDCYNAIDNLKEANEENPLNEDANLCTGPTTGGIAACDGDSGSPLVQIINEVVKTPYDPVEENTENYNSSLYNCPNDETNDGDNDNENSKQSNAIEAVLLGIVSWGVSPCGEVGAPTVYTNVSTYQFFIEYNMKNN